MAFLQANVFSNVLNMDVGVNILLPQSTSRRPRPQKDDVPVLYLLHGMGGNQTVWSRRSSIERYVREQEIAVVMPSTELGFYTDTRYGMAYWRFVADELPEIIHELFPQITTKREKTFAAGLSMGGYGAVKLGLKRPERFAAVASLSGALSLGEQPESLLEAGSREYWEGIFGPLEEIAGSENDPIQMIAEVDPQAAPKFFVCCGKEDGLFPASQYFVHKAGQRDLDVTFEDGPGVHNWDFWDQWIQRVLEWLPYEK